MRARHRLLLLAFGANVLACNPKRDPPQQTPTSGSVGATSGAGGGFTSGSGPTSTVGSGPQPDVDHCACIFATQHDAACEDCVADEQSSSCKAAWQACAADPDCGPIATFCIRAAPSDAATIDACLGSPGKVRDLLEAYFQCVCDVGNCAIKCHDKLECGGTTASASSASASSGTTSSTGASGSTTAASGTGGAAP
ncbi:MAG: hypothetical protein U0414_16420 [Polyangiaceae bacterium]